MTPTGMPEPAALNARGPDEAVEPERVVPEVTASPRRRFTGVRYTVDQT